MDNNRQPWITDGAWKTGLLGAFSVLLFAYAFSLTHVKIVGDTGDAGQFGGYFVLLERLGGLSKTDQGLLCLALVATVMIASEMWRLRRFLGARYITLSPLLQAKQYRLFFTDAVVRYLKLTLLFWLIIQFYRSAGEYGFQHHSPYYQPWFTLLGYLWWLFIYLGLPYIVLTRALQHNGDGDNKDYARLVDQLALKLWDIVSCNVQTPRFDNALRASLRGLLVKLFFAPIMTVFFIDQFGHLTANINYLLHGLPARIDAGHYNHDAFNRDLVNISASIIFAIDVALAWCGYLVSSRWVDNQTVSAEPTLLGWATCVLSYPPFRVIVAWLFVGPGDKLFLSLPNASFVTLFAVMMIASYLVYLSVTVCFGLRFSNLTHRGIIRSGAFAWVRHPAYAAKNFGWWCVGFPMVIYQINSIGWRAALLMFLGLCLNSWIYYWRAITEERHLCFDPRYQDYCRQVPYRFIPRVL